MTREDIESILERVATWPEEAREEFLHSLDEIEARHGDAYELTDEDRAAIERGLADMRAGRLVDDAEVTALFNRYFA